METLVALAVIAAMIIIGVFLIHLLNTQNSIRIASYRFSAPLPGIIRRRRHRNRAEKGPERTA
ncbi:hypothetical protein [Streptomyces sp. NPDC050145]|uniref:hypothetical protein n=1 Tax=Streptomyces sp. NPDC050145 TaxID=3365602 RepID=UPI00378AE3E8